MMLKPKAGAEFLWVRLTASQGSKLPLTVNLFDVKVTSGQGVGYPLLGLDTVLKDTCCNVSVNLTNVAELLKHVGSTTSDLETTINKMGQPETALLVARKSGAAFSLAFETKKGEGSLDLHGFGQKPLRVRPFQKVGQKK